MISDVDLPSAMQREEKREKRKREEGRGKEEGEGSLQHVQENSRPTFFFNFCRCIDILFFATSLPKPSSSLRKLMCNDGDSFLAGYRYG